MSHYWHSLNMRVMRHFDQAPNQMQSVWGWGGSGSDYALRRFNEWFEDLYFEFLEIVDANECYEDTRSAGLSAVAEILELPMPADGIMKYLVRIRNILAPNETWNDWPYDVTGMEDSSDEDELMFAMDD